MPILFGTTSSKHNCIRLWFPNIFEARGGIQAYLKDLLTAVAAQFPASHLIVFNKLDRAKVKEKFNLKEISFF